MEAYGNISLRIVKNNDSFSTSIFIDIFFLNSSFYIYYTYFFYIIYQKKFFAQKKKNILKRFLTLNYKNLNAIHMGNIIH